MADQDPQVFPAQQKLTKGGQHPLAHRFDPTRPPTGFEVKIEQAEWAAIHSADPGSVYKIRRANLWHPPLNGMVRGAQAQTVSGVLSSFVRFDETDRCPRCAVQVREIIAYDGRMRCMGCGESYPPVPLPVTAPVTAKT